MSRARAMLERVRKLEANNQHWIVQRYGSVERFKRIFNEPQPGVDPRVGSFMAACIDRWVDGSDRTSNDPVPEEFRTI